MDEFLVLDNLSLTECSYLRNSQKKKIVKYASNSEKFHLRASTAQPMGTIKISRNFHENLIVSKTIGRINKPFETNLPYFFKLFEVVDNNFLFD